MRHLFRVSLLALATTLLLGCNGVTKPSGEPPKIVEPKPPMLLDWPDWTMARDTDGLTELGDVALRDSQGRPWILSRHKGKVIIMQAGSASSPAYLRSLEAYGQLMAHEGLEDLLHVTIYSEEAHPELIGPANPKLRWVLSADDRAALAQAGSYKLVYMTSGGKQTVMGTRAEGQVVLVDYLDQSRRIENVWGLELGYGRGAHENPVVVLDAEGKVAFAAADLGSSMDALHDFLHEHFGLASHEAPPAIDEVPAVDPAVDEVPAVDPAADEVPAVDPAADEVPAVDPAAGEVPAVEPPAVDPSADQP